MIRTGGEQPEGDVTAALAAAAPADVDAPADPGPAPPHGEAVSDEEAAQVQARRRRFLAELGEFRRSRVLVPVGALPGPNAEEAPLTVDMGGVRWILAFTGEAALARYVVARGEDGRAWPYRSVWGAALLDAAVPAVAESGVPCGVLVNAADGAHGLVLPPVAQVVPEAVAVNGPEHRMDGEENR
ncbi:SseB family protein [Streptomyces hygroscopicus]|uniref:SseB family protein n=1 Tax=Streptomyces hygroscopicus TaxID=1912 RepID=UPI0022405C7E|nr:SseB family protein [Streptomyces hygroscopicus]